MRREIKFFLEGNLHLGVKNNSAERRNRTKYLPTLRLPFNTIKQLTFALKGNIDYFPRQIWSTTIGVLLEDFIF